MSEGYMTPDNVCMTSRRFKHFKQEEKTKLPELDKFVEVDVMFEPLKRFLKLLKGLKLTSVEVVYTTKYLSFICSTDLGVFKYEAPIVEQDDNNMTKYGGVSCKYGVEYLNSIFEEWGLKNCLPTVKLSYGSDYPLTIEYMDDWAVVAPRVGGE